MSELVLFTHKAPSQISNEEMFNIVQFLSDATIAYTIDKIQELKPKIVLALGQEALEILFTGVKIKSSRGKLLFSEKYNCRVLATLDPFTLGKKGKKIDENKYAIDKRLLLSDLAYAQAQAEKKEFKHQYISILAGDRELFDRFIIKLAEQKKWACDIETDEDEAFRIENAKILGIGFSWKAGTGAYVLLRDQQNTIPEEEFNYRIEKLKSIFANDAAKIEHNGKYDTGRLLATLGIVTKNFTFDTMLAHHLEDENRRHSLDDISTTVADLAQYKHESEAFLPKKGASFTCIPTSILARRCCADADLTFRLEGAIRSSLEKMPRVYNLFKHIIMPHQDVLMRGELRGVLIDIAELNRIEPIIKFKIEELKKKVFEAIGEEINLDSDKQVRQIFKKFNLQIPKECVTKSGAISTNQYTLEKIANQHVFCKTLVKYNQLGKLYSTYIQGIQKRLSIDNTLHTSYKVHGTVTGRLSSTNPNLQNIPTDQKLNEDYGLEGISIHSLFIARPGYKLITSDASQIELRMLAVLSQDQSLIKAYRDGEDLHTLTALAIVPGAREIYNQYQLLKTKDFLIEGPIADKWKMIRSIAKTVNFGIAYGRGAKSLVEQLEVSYRQAQGFIDGFFERYPGTYTWINTTIGLAKHQGYVENIFGRRRRLPDINASTPFIRAEAERQSQNFPVQGSAADVTAIANIRVDRLFKEYNIDGHFLLNIHDEIVFEVKEEQIDKAIELVKKGWTDPIKGINVSIEVSINVSDKWNK